MTDKPLFSGSMPEYYDNYLGPAQFDPFGRELAQRLPARPPGDVLELACGTGLVTRRLRERLDPSLRLVATDLSKPMLDYARAKLADCPGIEWREADAMKLPFADKEFGAAACAFGAMFMPDKGAFFREARRVLKPGGLLLLSVWNRIEENRHGQASAHVIQSLFPGDPDANFGTPYSMHDQPGIRAWLAESGFGDVAIDTVRLPLGRVSARTFAMGAVYGTPRASLLARKGADLAEVADKVAAELARVGGADPYIGEASALIVSARAA
jgi:SAM-dependent methyltransferase